MQMEKNVEKQLIIWSSRAVMRSPPENRRISPKKQR